MSRSYTEGLSERWVLKGHMWPIDNNSPEDNSSTGQDRVIDPPSQHLLLNTKGVNGMNADVNAPMYSAENSPQILIASWSAPQWRVIRVSSLL